MEVSGGADRTEEEERMEGMDKELIRRLSTRDFAKGQRLAKERRWEAIQIKTFKAWINCQLAPRGINVKDLDADLKSGVVLVNLLEVLTGHKVARRDRDFKHDLVREIEVPFSLANLRVALDFIEQNIGLRLVNCSAEEIVKGNIKIILAVLWVLIRKFHIVDPALRNATATVSDSSELQGAAEKHLLAWVREKTCGLVEVTNFTSSFQSGLAFCALLHHYRPDLIDFDQLPDDPKANLELAFEVAETHCGVARLLDADDVIAYPEDLCILIYALVKDSNKKAAEPVKKLSLSNSNLNNSGGSSAAASPRGDISSSAGSVPLPKRKSSKSFFFMGGRDRDSSGDEKESSGNEAGKERSDSAEKKQDRNRVSFSPRNSGEISRIDRCDSGNYGGGGSSTTTTATAEAPTKSGGSGEGGDQKPAKGRMWAHWRSRDEPHQPQSQAQGSNSSGDDDDRDIMFAPVGDSRWKAAERLFGPSKRSGWGLGFGLGLSLGGSSGSSSSDLGLRRSKSGTFESRQREKEREREREREREKERDREREREKATAVATTAANAAAAATSATNSSASSGEKNDNNASTTNGDVSSGNSDGRGVLRRVSLTNLRKRRSASLVERSERERVDRETKMAAMALYATAARNAPHEAVAESSWAPWSPARPACSSRATDVLLSPRGRAQQSTTAPAEQDDGADSSSSPPPEEENSSIYDAFEALEKAYATISHQDKFLSEALMMKLEETRRLLSSTPGSARSRSRSRSRPIQLAQAAIDPTLDSANRHRGASDPEADRTRVCPPRQQQQQQPVHPAVSTDNDEPVPTTDISIGSDGAADVSTARDRKDSAGTQALAPTPAPVLQLHQSQPDLLLPRSARAVQAAPVHAPHASVGLLGASVEGEEEVDVTCLGARVRGELTERGAEQLKLELEAFRSNSGWYGTTSKQAVKGATGKRRRRPRELAVIVTGELGEKSLASLALVGGALKRLCIGDNEEFNELEELVAAVPEVTDLKLERCPQLANLAPLTALQQLVCLSLDDLPSVTDLQMLSSLRSLEELSIRTCCLSSPPSAFAPTFAPHVAPFSLTILTPLHGLRALRLTSADLDDRSSAELQPLETLTRLEVLSLRRSTVRSLDGLRRCKRLRVLDLHSNPLVSVAALSTLTALERLCLAGTWCEDYSQLRQLRSLVELNLDLSAFAQLEVIESLPHLRTLSLARCPIARAKWAYLALARNLRELNVAHTSFTDCTVLSGPDPHGLAPMPSNDDVSTTTTSGRPLANDGNEEQSAPAASTTTRIVVTEPYDHSTDEGDDNDNDGARAVVTASQQQREALTVLERLDLDGCHVHEKGMCGLKYLASLKYLSIRQVSSIGDLSTLAGCGGLRYLYLDQDQVPSHLLHHLQSLIPKLTIHVSPPSA